MAHILLVDDDLRFVSALRASWRLVHRINVCGTVAEAIAILARDCIDLVVTEYRLPDGLGLDLLRRIKTDVPTIPVVMVTAYGSEWVCAGALKLGVRDYFIKPCDLSDIELCVRSILQVTSRRQDRRDNALHNDDRLYHPASTACVSELHIPHVRRALRFIHEHYWDSITLSALASDLGISKFSLSRQFKAAMHLSFRRYLLNVRVAKARELLLRTDSPITQVAQMVGFGDLPRFDKVFRQLEGVSPSSFRTKHIKPPSASDATRDKDHIILEQPTSTEDNPSPVSY